MDSEQRYIDQNFEDQIFDVVMTDLQPMTSVSIDFQNKTNGAITKYTISIVPSTKIHDNDMFSINFPPEIKLPFDIQCSSASPYILSFFCQKLNFQNAVIFTLVDVSARLKIGTEITLSVNNVQNSVSMRPSSSFTNMVLTDYTTQEAMSDFHGEVQV
jgi:hypothetical protein